MTSIRKDIRNNWRAEDSIELGSNRVLQVTTVKVSSGEIVTRASVHKRAGGFLSHMMFQDFSQCLKTSQSRCTEKNVTAQHNEAMKQIDAIKEAVTAHYDKALA